MRYDDVTIEIDGESVRAGTGPWMGKFTVRVLQSPAGEMRIDQAIPVEFNLTDLQRQIDRLERRELKRADLIALGRTLASILLPPPPASGGKGVIDFVRESLIAVGADNGIRLRLRLRNELTVFPWEYVFVERDGGEGMDGFLALDPRVAIVRHEVISAPVALPVITGNVKAVVATAAPEGWPPLDVDNEMAIITQALDGVPGVSVVPREHATLSTLQPLLPGSGVFHFAGHGDFKKSMGTRPGTYVGTGSVALEDELVDAEQLGINLNGNGIRLAVLGGCNTGRRDGVNVWSGIAPALVKRGVAAVVANQFAILDNTAIAFSRGLYQALSGGLPLERAVTAGRIAAYNADTDGRDWGVAVLYLRASGDGQLFQGAADSVERDRAREGAEAVVNVRAKNVAKGGLVKGVDVARMIKGKVAVKVVVAGEVFGTVIGGEFDEISGGTTDLNVDVDSVGEGGTVIGGKFNNVGFDNERSVSVPKPQAVAEPKSRSFGLTPREASPPPAPASTTNVNVGTVSGGTVIGEQNNKKLGDNVQIGSVTIINNSGGNSPEKEMLEEKLRLDVVVPKAAVVDDPFVVVVAVMQPNAPTLTASDLEQVHSAPGVVYRPEENTIVRYRVEVTGAGLDVKPPHFVFKLRSGESSIPIAFQVTALKPGKRTLFVNAYQDDDVLAAQTRLSIEVTVAVST
jgi:hypothetical protein